MEKIGDALVETFKGKSEIKHRQLENDNEYYDDEGFVCCRVCKKRKEFEMPFPGGQKIIVPVLCECGMKKRREEEERAKLTKQVERIKRLKENSLIDNKFANSTFDSIVENRDNSRQIHICKRYAEKFDELRKKNQGLLLYGTVGSGKTHLACCIGNYIMEHLRTVLATSLVKILQNASAMNEESFTEKMKDVDLLIIDDLGAERGTDYALETVYNIIDSRYRAGKPMIVTTNLTINDMQNPVDMRYKRIYDRIFEVCYPVEFTGKSWRMKEAAHRFDEMKKILED